METLYTSCEILSYGFHFTPPHHFKIPTYQRMASVGTETSTAEMK